jgi:pimeloyl-ACP methyl ester carboxylesterase
VQVQWKGREIDVREAGIGPALVLIHGYPLDGGMWSGVARRLAERFRVLKPDLPGRPDNPAETTGRIDDYADFIGAILEELPPPVGVAGFSIGGYVALALLRRRPGGVGALALIDTRAGADDEAARARREEAIEMVRTKGVDAIADSMLEKLLSPPSFARRDLVDRVRRIILRQQAASLESDLKAMRDRPDSTEFLREISLPVLVAVGEHDALTPPAEAESMAAAIPGARLATIPGAGHLTPMEQPRLVASALREHFEQTQKP